MHLFSYVRRQEMNIDELIAYLFSPIAQVALIMGIAEIFKRMDFQKKYIPLVDLVFGLLSGIFVYGIVMEYGIAKGIILGVALGLSACGLFSGIKNVTQDDREE